MTITMMIVIVNFMEENIFIEEKFARTTGQEKKILRAIRMDLRQTKGMKLVPLKSNWTIPGPILISTYWQIKNGPLK